MNIKSFITKVFPMGCMAVLLVCCLVALPGCGSSDDELITENLTTQLNALKNVDDNVVDEVASAAEDEFGSIGLDATDYVKSLLDGFDYTIGKITVDGETASVDLSVTAKSLSDIQSQFMTEYTNQLNAIDGTSIADDSTLYQMAGDALMSAIDAAEPKTVDCTIEYSKDDDGNWTPNDPVGTTIYAAIDAAPAADSAEGE